MRKREGGALYNARVQRLALDSGAARHGKAAAAAWRPRGEMRGELRCLREGVWRGRVRAGDAVSVSWAWCACAGMNRRWHGC